MSASSFNDLLQSKQISVDMHRILSTIEDRLADLYTKVYKLEEQMFRTSFEVSDDSIYIDDNKYISGIQYDNGYSAGYAIASNEAEDTRLALVKSSNLLMHDIMFLLRFCKAFVPMDIRCNSHKFDEIMTRYADNLTENETEKGE